MNSSDGVMNSTVLVADDDPVFRALVVKRIEMLGARAIEASNGVEAWQVLMSKPVDLALIDIDMPGMTGVELIQCIRGYPKTRHLPAVVITSISRSETVRQALGAGCTGYLTKPLQSVMFNGYIGHLLELSQQSKMVERKVAEQHSALAGAIAAGRTRALAAIEQAGATDAGTLQVEITAIFDVMTRTVTASDEPVVGQNVHAA